MLESDKEISHESFGLISACRSYGGGHFFFGSDMQPNQYITIKIRKNCRMRYSPVMGKRYDSGNSKVTDEIEIEMTSTQFAEFITSLNVGEGVPCNVVRFGKERMPQYTETQDTEFEYQYKQVSERLSEQRERYEEAKKKILEICDKLSGKKQEEIIKVINKLETEMCDNIPFHLKNVKKATEEIVSKAKIEISNYMNVASNVASDRKLGSNERPLEIETNL